MVSVDEQSDSVASRVAVGLSQLGLAMKSQAWADAGERGLTPTQGQILALLKARADTPLRVSQVAELLAISAPTASDSVRALVKKGFIKKTRAHGDARAVALELTAAGRQEATRAAAWPDFLLCAIHSLSDSEQEGFLLALIKMLGVLAERGRIPHQRTCVCCRHFRPNARADEARPHRCELLGRTLLNRQLRVDCSDQVPLDATAMRRNLSVLTG